VPGERRKRALQTKIRTPEPTVSLERTTGSDSFGTLHKLNLSQRFPKGWRPDRSSHSTFVTAKYPLITLSRHTVMVCDE
jgi:hypothetical protein